MWLDRKGSTVLEVAECKQLLAVAANLELIGRVGIATDRAPVIIPVNFIVRDGQIVARIGRGFLSSAAADHLVTFEVDHVDTKAGWAWSVLVRGLATVSERLTEVEPDSGAHSFGACAGRAATHNSPRRADRTRVRVVTTAALTGRQSEVRESGVWCL